MLTPSLRSFASISTGYSKDTLRVIRRHKLLNRHLRVIRRPNCQPSYHHGANIASLAKKTPPGRSASADVVIGWSGGLLLVAIPPYGDGPGVVLTVPHYFVAFTVGHACTGNLAADGLQVLAVVVVLV